MNELPIILAKSLPARIKPPPPSHYPEEEKEGKKNLGYLFIVVTARTSVRGSSEGKNFIAKAIVRHLDGEHLPLHR